MHYLILIAMLVSSFSYCQAQSPPPPGQLIHLQIETTLVPSPAAVHVLLPPGYEQLSDPVPLLIWLHGGTSGKAYLGNHLRQFIEQAWASGDLTPCVVVAPVTGASFFMDWHDGTHQWDTFITGPMLAQMRKNYQVNKIAQVPPSGEAPLEARAHCELLFATPPCLLRRRPWHRGFPQC